MLKNRYKWNTIVNVPAEVVTDERENRSVQERYAFYNLLNIVKPTKFLRVLQYMLLLLHLSYLVQKIFVFDKVS